MWLILLVLLLTPISQAQHDGCGHRQWRCGDICIGDSSPCHCGNQTTFFREINSETQFETQFVKTTTHLTWCCSHTTCQGLGEAEVRWEFRGAFLSGANCSSGTVLKLTEPCPNQLPSTQKTVNQTRIRLGGKATVSCNDYNAPDTERSYIPCWEPNQTITECIKKSQLKDGKYHCKSRSDERPFSKDATVFDFTSLMKECTDHNKEAGLMCPDHGCLRFDDWCQIKTISERGETEGPRKCGPPGQHFFSNDKRVCSHPTFWTDKTCTEYRCSGAFPGQCGATLSVRGITC